MTTYNTGNRIGSNDPRDLYDNAENFDRALNETVMFWVDRLGITRRTEFGREFLFNQFIESINEKGDQLLTEAEAAFRFAISQVGFVTIDSFQAGATLTASNEALRDTNTGEYYRWDGVFPKSVPVNSTPESSGGMGLGKWISVGDAALRSSLSKYDGSLLVGRAYRNLNDWLNDLPTVGDYIYPGISIEQAFMDAINTLNAKGGGTLNIPAMTYLLTGTITVNLTTPITLNFMAGSSINQTVDADMFNVAFTSTGSLRISGEAFSTCSFSGKSATAALWRLAGSGNLRDVVFDGKFCYRPANSNNQFRYGAYLIGVQEPDLRGLLLYGSDTRANHWLTACHMTNGANQASTAGKFWGPSAYNVLYGLVVESTQKPGVEGLRVMAGDFVSCQHGIVINNSNAGYVPPQFEIVHCHINSYGANMTFIKCVGINISGGLYYRYDSTTTDEHLIFESCQGIAVTGGTFMQNNDSSGAHINNPVMRFKGTAAAPTAIASVSGCKFWVNSDNTNSPIALEGVISQFQLSDGNIKTTSAKWLDTSLLTSDLGTVNKSENLQSDAGEPTTYTATVVSGVLDVRNSLVKEIILSGVDSSTIITSILGRRGWTYGVRSDVVGVSISPSVNIQFAGISSNVSFSVAGCNMRFHMSSFNVARFIGSSVAQLLRSPALPIQAPSYATGSLPSAASNTAGIIFVTGLLAQRIPAYSEGTSWRKFSDNTVIT